VLAKYGIMDSYAILIGITEIVHEKCSVPIYEINLSSNLYQIWE
jgi:hypothetical protein